MSDTSALYVRETMMPEREPPVGQTGAVRWIRENLLSGWVNILLTVVSFAVIYLIIAGIFAPRVFSMIWNAGTLTECREVFAANSTHLEYVEGICAAVIRDRWTQILMGTYPPQHYWRPILALVLLFVALAPVLFPERTPRKLLAFSAAYPFIMPWLLWGGSFWIPLLYMAGFGVAYLAYRIGSTLVNSLLGIILSIVVGLFWWIYAVGAISDGLHRVVAESRIDSARAGYVETTEQRSAEIDALEVEDSALTAQITDLEATKNELIAEIRAERLRRATEAELPEVQTLLAEALEGDWDQARADLRGVRDILTPFNTAFAAPDIAGPLEELRTAVRTNDPLGERPEGDEVALSSELIAQLEGYAELATSALDASAAGGLSDADLDALVTEYNQQIADLTVLREQSSAVGSDLKQTDDQRRLASNLVRNIDRREVNQAELPRLRLEAEEARAALPEIVAEIRIIPDDTSLLDPEITREQLQALRDVLSLEQDLVRAERSISIVYDEVGRIGLEPVNTENFGGFLLSLVIGVTAIIMSLPLGILLALARQSHLIIIKTTSVVFIEVIRGVPLIVWLMVANFLLNFFLPPGTEFDKVLRVIIMITLFSAAYIAEVVRGGLAALPKGQYEAADALGLDYWKSMRLIVLPQALKISIPGIVNTFIGLFKDTTLVIFIGLYDALGIIGTIRTGTDWNGIYWELFVFVGLVFFVFCFSMGRYSLYLERKLQREHR